MSQKSGIKHVAITGNIGTGKTTLSTLVSEHYGWDVMYEDTGENPYLNDFYHDMRRWSFNLQIYFLNSRYTQLLEIHNGDKTVVQDRTIYEDAYIFAPNLYEMSLMDERDFNNYISLFKTMSTQVAPPDLLIYLKANISTLVSHIQNRGREYEGSMSLDYLKKLNERYENWINNYKEGPKLFITVDDLDFKKNREDLSKIIEQIDANLHGLFNS